MTAVQLEQERLAHAEQTTEEHKSRFAQYFTPYTVAQFMASLFPFSSGDVRLLDPGAGIGILSCAFIDRIKAENWPVSNLSTTAYDIDSSVIQQLTVNLETTAADFPSKQIEIYNEDFLEKTSFDFTWNIHKTYTHVILNPPYRKIQTNSSERTAARLFGLETVNLYSAFLGASIALTEKNGYIAAIVPRSFCNGVYYKPFRTYILQFCAIKHLHLFHSRNKTFKDESVLQENIIILLQKDAPQTDVMVTHSDDASFSQITGLSVPFDSIVRTSDPDYYFNIPLTKELPAHTYHTVSLSDTGVSVSTGPIVDFRLKEFLLQDQIDDSVPLLYPVHFKKYKTVWPVQGKKPNAIKNEQAVQRCFFPSGYYVVVKRFSSKEEKQRIVASLITPQDFSGGEITFENHLNVFHVNKQGLDKQIAYGLVVWLNTSFIDTQFRLFSGHTQVNAADLRVLTYPTATLLRKMGEQLLVQTEWNQSVYNTIMEACIYE